MEALKTTIANGPQSRGTYKHLATRDMHADLAKVKPWRHDRKPKPRTVEALAWAYADHMLETGQTIAHVFPVTCKNGCSQSAMFRLYLAQKLACGRTSRATYPMWVGSRHVRRLTELREHAESRLSASGFEFREIDPREYR